MSRGTLAEDAVQHLAEASFLSDFVFRDTNYEKGSGRREAGDVLIWFDNTVIIVECKTRATSVPPSSRSAEREMAWAASQLETAHGQLRGSRRALQARHIKALRNERRGRIDFDPSCVTHMQGLIIIDQTILPYDPVALVPGLADKNFPTHVFSLAEWSHVCSEMSTAPDFLAYLQFRSRHLKTTRLLVGAERDLMAAFIILERDPLAKVIDLGGLDGLGDRFVALMGPSIAQRNDADIPSYLVDDLINRLHDIDPSLVPDLDLPSVVYDSYIEVAVELSKLNRTYRRVLGDKMLERIKLATKEGRERYSAVQIGEKVFFFLASPEPRPDRSGTLASLTALAKYATKTQVAIGIATEASMGAGRSYDTCYFEYPWKQDAQADDLLEHTFGVPTPSTVTEFRG